MAINRREHLEVYILASAANALLSIGQFLAINSALGIKISQQSTVANLVGYNGSRTTLLMEYAQTGLIFQATMAILVIVVLCAAVSRATRKWPYALTGMAISSYVGYVLGQKFLDLLQWVELDITFGISDSDAYTDLIWFGLGATICYFAMIMVLNKSYGKMVPERTG